MRQYCGWICMLMLVWTIEGKCQGQEVKYTPGGTQVQKVWKQFYAGDHESELDDPLIDAGTKMTLPICTAISHSNMKFRRYAIGALGFIHDKRALPTLASILQDKREQDYLRGDALQAIYQINEKLARKYAVTYKLRKDDLGETTQAVLKKEKWLTERSEEGD